MLCNKDYAFIPMTGMHLYVLTHKKENKKRKLYLYAINDKTAVQAAAMFAIRYRVTTGYYNLIKKPDQLIVLRGRSMMKDLCARLGINFHTS